jgi:hypothetical protein
MYQAVTAWLNAGQPPHYVYVLGAYAVLCFVLSKIPKVRANTVAEAIFNALNPKLLPLVARIPIFGIVLAGFLGLWDTPAAAPAPKDPS